MKRSKLLKYLRINGCILLREGGNHSWWINPAQNKLTPNDFANGSLHN